MTNIGKISASAALVLGLAVPAFAGPQMTFGPEDKGVLQLDYKGQFQMSVRDTGSGSGDDNTTMNFNFRRNRLALMGAYGDWFGLYVQTEFVEDQNITTLGVANYDLDSEFQILDAAMRFNFHDALKVTVGKFKYNLSRENLEACENPLTLDRSLFIRAPLVTTRDMGVAVWGNVFNDMFQYRLDVMEGRKASSSDGSPESNFRYTARGHVSLLDPETDYGYKGTYLGKKKVLTFGGAYQIEPDAVYSDTSAKTGAKDYRAWTVDGFFEYPVPNVGTVTLSAAYEKISLMGAYKGTNPDSGSYGLNGEKNGWYVKAGYMVPSIPLQLFGRYEKWSFAKLNGTYDQRVDWYGVGANYYFWGQNLKLTGEFSSTNFDKEDSQSKDFNTFIAQLQLVF